MENPPPPNLLCLTLDTGLTLETALTLETETLPRWT